MKLISDMYKQEEKMQQELEALNRTSLEFPHCCYCFFFLYLDQHQISSFIISFECCASSYFVNTFVYIAEMSTQTRSGGGGGGRNKSKASKENKENAGTDDSQQQQQQPLQQQKGGATNNSGGGEPKQKKGTDNSGSKGGDSKDKQHHQTTTHVKVKQPTAEQIRIAQITDIKSGMDDPKIQEKIQNLMETTQRSEEEVCCALQECDNDLDRAVIFLLETLPVGAFATTSKKKKNKSQNKEQNDAAPSDGDWDNGAVNTGSGSGGGGGSSSDPKDRRGNRSGNTQRTGGGGSGGVGSGRGGRGNFRDGDRGGDRDRNGFDRGGRGPRGRDGRDGGPGRGSYNGGGSRGGRGGGPRVGTRGPGLRDQNRGARLTDHQEIDAWDPVTTTNSNDLNKPEESSAFTDTWGDWDNEEYTGSLSDTKVFTPSTQSTVVSQQPQGAAQPQQTTSQLPPPQSQPTPQSQSQQQSTQQQPSLVAAQPAAVTTSVTNPTELSAPPGLEQQILNPPQPKETDLVQQYSTTVVSSTATAAAAASNTVQYPDLHSTSSTTQHLRQTIDIPQINSSSSLSAEQSQYFNTLSSQNSNLQPSVVNTYPPSTVQYPATFGSSSSYSEQVSSSQQAPVARRPRARVPPPSKIPSSAVEMPGDSLNNIGYLDVQFGALDFGTDDSFDSVSVTDKFNANSLEQNAPSAVQLPPTVQPTQPDVSDYQSKSNVVNNLQPKSNLSSSMQNPQILSGQNDPLTATQSDPLSSSYSQRNSSTVVPSSVSTGVNVNSINSTTSTLEQLTKTDPYSQSTGTNAASGGYQNVSYSTSQANKTSSYPSSAAPQGYNNSSYSNSQVSTNTYPASSNNYSSYNQSGVNSYQQPSSNVSSSVVPNNNSNSSVGVSAVNQSNPNLPVNSSNVSNNSSNSNAGYLSSQYPVSQTSSAFPSQQNYQNSSQNVYGNTGLNSNTGYSSSASTSSGQYSNFSSSKLKDTPVSTQFESVASSTVPNNNNTNNNNVSNSSSSLPNSSVVSTTTKSSSSSGTGVVPNIPMVNPYIQPGVPFYQQPVYSYEDLQMIQQRMSGHVPGYYDVNYQTPTSLGAGGVRDANLGSVAYSTMSDGRFTRTDNNSSPVSNVPSTMSQQTGSGGPMLNLPYAYFYGGNVMPTGFQYGTPAIYPQQMATNATSGGQFQKPAYNSGYGTSGYDTLSQTGQDYNKNAYPTSNVGQQSKGQTVSNPQSAGGTGSDIAPSMYGKSHVALNKVNSYEKQSFHSGTPPPYNIAGTQTAGATSAQPYGQHLYIPTIPTHHNINMHQAMHQMDNRSFNSGSGVMRDSNSSGQRPQSNSQGKTATKQGYSPSTYWAAQN
ncbi:protein lingerer isoform X2 [Malaya genurostris]|uniref:protein lingerer isoform X2 n=1 Tax=Malaya genurostris TaxID=325434 RepID=UPI0026F3F411|nr:protein lingerer isoform X2 [Malaya genurostris]